MSGETTIKRKGCENNSEKNDMRSLNKQPDIMDWHLDLVNRDYLLRRDVEIEASYELGDLTPLGEKPLLAHLVKEELSRHYFLEFASLLDTRAKWTRFEMQSCFPEIKHLICPMIDCEMSYRGAVFKINMKRKDPLRKAVDKFCLGRGLSNDGYRLFLSLETLRAKGNG